MSISYFHTMKTQRDIIISRNLTPHHTCIKIAWSSRHTHTHTLGWLGIGGLYQYRLLVHLWPYSALLQSMQSAVGQWKVQLKFSNRYYIATHLFFYSATCVCSCRTVPSVLLGVFNLHCSVLLCACVGRGTEWTLHITRALAAWYLIFYF